MEMHDPMIVGAANLESQRIKRMTYNGVSRVGFANPSMKVKWNIVRSRAKALLALLLTFVCGTAEAVHYTHGFVNTYTVNDVKWYLSAENWASSVKSFSSYCSEEGINGYGAAQFSSAGSGNWAYYHITIDGFSGSDDDVKNLKVPGTINWDSNGAAGIANGNIYKIASWALSDNNVMETVDIDSNVKTIGVPCFRNLSQFDDNPLFHRWRYGTHMATWRRPISDQRRRSVHGRS